MQQLLLGSRLLARLLVARLERMPLRIVVCAVGPATHGRMPAWELSIPLSLEGALGADVAALSVEVQALRTT